MAWHNTIVIIHFNITSVSFDQLTNLPWYVTLGIHSTMLLPCRPYMHTVVIIANLEPIWMIGFTVLVIVHCRAFTNRGNITVSFLPQTQQEFMLHVMNNSLTNNMHVMDIKICSTIEVFLLNRIKQKFSQGAALGVTESPHVCSVFF